jgi:hypothetical protein
LEGFKVNEERKIRFLGAVLECIVSYPRFDCDFDYFLSEGIIKPVSEERLKWTKSKSSLAEYFAWIKQPKTTITGGFWAPIEMAFDYERGSLRRLAGSNGNAFKKPSKDFEVIKKGLIPYRANNLRNRERYVFREIKRIANELSIYKPETIHSALKEIHALFNK